VFRTYEPSRDRLAAVKVFRLDLTPEQARSLTDELQRLVDAGLGHPSIVAPLAAGMDGGTAYLAEEYVAGESLDIAIRHYAPAPLDTALPFIAQLAGALDFARAAGLGHGTLHPRDIFLTPDEARATGFGIASALEAVGLRPPVRRPYSAPERVAGGTWGAPADVFALGAIGYELLTGRRIAGPLAASDTLELRGADPLVARLLAGPLVRALAENPAARYPTALAFARALEAAAEGEEERHVAAAAAGSQAPEVVSAPNIKEFPTTVQPSLVGAFDDALDAFGDAADSTPMARDNEIESKRAFEPKAAVERKLELNPEPRLEPDDLELEPTRQLIPQPPPRELRPISAAEPVSGLGFERELNRQHLDREPELEPELKPEREPREPRVPGEPREPMRVLPLALMLVAGVLVGFVAGYAVGTRNQPDGDGSAAAAPAGAAWSEAKLDPPTPPPAAAEPPAATPAPPPPAPVATRGTIVVRSTPARAGVVVDGVWRGRTPLTLPDLRFGRHTVRVAERGYGAESRVITLSAEQNRQEIELRLAATPTSTTGSARRGKAPAPTRARTSTPPPARPTAQSSTSAISRYTGSLYVDSRPRGARVFIDGRPVGVTPLQLPDVAVGSHVVRMELEKHRTWASSTRVVAGETMKVTGSLEQVP
jgi:serine/threonine protein kinase